MQSLRDAAQAADPAAEPLREEARHLLDAGARGLVVPASFEEAFYRHGNLPEQLRRCFAGLNPARVDEDLLETQCSRAEALIRTTYLMDDAVQQFYRALAREGLDQGTVSVRRLGTKAAETVGVTPPGTAALHALKRIWARDWTFEAVLERVDGTGSISLEARPTLVLASS